MERGWSFLFCVGEGKSSRVFPLARDRERGPREFPFVVRGRRVDKFFPKMESVPRDGREHTFAP